MPRTIHVITLQFLTAFHVYAAGPTTVAALERQFTGTVRPFVETYCISCHSGDKPAAQFDLRFYTSMSAAARDHAHWALVLEKLNSQQMPPAAAKQPPPEARKEVAAWIAAMRDLEARKNAGDPGLVLARRLSNAEYNYTIRDLTGIDIRPTREFPVDPANQAGFDNSGESLAMSPALLDKYLQAAREVANHMVLKPDGIGFAPHIVLVETDRDKYAVNQIINFYRRQPTAYSAYFEAAWRYKHRAALGKPQSTLEQTARAANVSPKYLATIWRALEHTPEDAGPLLKLQTMWRTLPAADRNRAVSPREGCERMQDFVVQLRRKTELRHADIVAKGVGRTAQPFLMWRNRQYAAHRTDFDRAALQVEGEPMAVAAAQGRTRVPADNDADEQEPARKVSVPAGPDPDLHVPAGQRARYEAAFARFSAIFPDAFYLPERGRYFPDNTRDTGRHLSAGFHNLMGYFRDDLPLYNLILDAKGQKQLDGYWKELDFVASAGIRTFVQFYLNESGEARGTGRESEGPRPADKEITSEATIRAVEEAYLAKIRAANNQVAEQAIREHFQSVNAGIRWVEQTRAQAERRHIEALQQFAARAYRRPLTAAERSDLTTFYSSLREKNGLSHEDAMRDALVSVLMSPDFCYRIDLVEGAQSRQPLSAHALASRLSYYLWSSMPDAELSTHATAGDLRNPAVLAAQARRMLKDSRARGLVAEFAGNWLDFRRFEEHNAVDRERFPRFTSDLRQAMFEEPIRFIEDVVRNNRSILDMLHARHTFVNPVLAKHYGIETVSSRTDGSLADGSRVDDSRLDDSLADNWVRIDDARPYGRGGLLPMSVFLTKNAPGLRTSPVKRGYWVVKRVLGEEIPPPPAVVPELPQDEAILELPLRDMLAKHRADPSCAGCHARFDSFGLVLEGYGPVGERRARDLAGRPVDTRAPFPGGREEDGFEGLLRYIREHRQKDFVDNLCRKMLVYALGRGLMLSDELLIQQMQARLAASGYRFHTMVESVVTSPQFLTKRGRDAVRLRAAASPPAAQESATSLPAARHRAALRTAARKGE